jgi:hypothetical protein
VTDLDELEAKVTALVAMAVDAATTLPELVECAHAAAALGNDELLEHVAARLATNAERALASSSAWASELTYSKIDAWEQTGHQARLLAEGFGAVVPLLRARATA